ncbi:hypothetical protein I4I73_28465 [Pseudonocardia sp. KRD-184]|uniref:Excisionase family DNA binding protein n=1 Tax=Pseudonocardia oceani TaxID=2792013 RepID=A0ABS6U7M6_9PSEU|nr:hypothetical protein [Pseudonocardia oceani]MBW0093490.1 hypothetical protein [Pseudonocardia oceani]MBW0099922.1 hypothetical protein [Pseudonocardia oceani]MBW0112642.1 hypothetical protein [Pseudonocardia oceani]MBW0125729.1 hypothetical protein [Pseudonocardia oceani]MBW0128236.1 hypothetical protein [Pseudonocardia oceani]
MPQFRIADAARLPGVSDDTVRRRVEAGMLPVQPFVSLLPAEAVHEMELRPGVLAVAVITSTDAVVEAPGGTP